MSIGRLLNNILDKFLPDVVGDVIGAAVDGATGNWAGLALNAADAFEDVLDACGADDAADVFGALADVAERLAQPASGEGPGADGLAALARNVLA
jgi:hypothetical protein